MSTGLTMNNRRSVDETRSFPSPEDQGLIPGDLEHEFLLLKKKKFAGINIVQVIFSFIKKFYLQFGDNNNNKKKKKQSEQ
jgi:hypothetical protein